ncbi:MAG: hypothetical protein LC721_03085 [Actinobacteria bacterium]|nr:hypothetical protein [Actinomycetota bacterium]
MIGLVAKLEGPAGLKGPQHGRVGGEQTQPDVAGLGVLAREIQHGDTLPAKEIHRAQVDDEQASSSGIKLAVQHRTEHRRAGLWVPNWSSTSCDLGIFVDQSTEPIVTSDVRLGGRRRGWERLERRCLVECSVRSVGVEVRHVLGQHSL